MNIKSSALDRSPGTLLIMGIAITGAVYWPGLQGTFFFDDETNILWQEAIQLTDLSFQSIKLAMISGIAGPLGRPVSQLSFALNYYFSGFDPFAFKLTNLVIHCLNGLLVYLITIRLLTATHQKNANENTRVLAAIVAVAWLLHPIQLTSVLYVVQRMTSFSALFVFSGILLHISARENNKPGIAGLWLLLIAWLVFWPLAVLTKESGILFFGYVSAYELIIRRSRRQGLDCFARILLWSTLLIVVSLIVYLLTPTGSHWLQGGYGTRTFTLNERALTEPRVIWNYLEMIIAPRLEAFALHHDDIVLSNGLFKPWTTFFALSGIISLFLTAWLTRNRQPLLSFGIAWFLIAHSLESSILSLEIAHEHRNYIGLLGVLLLPVAIMRLLYNHKKQRMAWASLMILLLAYTGFVTALRSHQFGNEIRRTQLEAQHHPLSARSNYEAALALVNNMNAIEPSAMQTTLAHKHYELSVELEPTAKMGYLGLIHLNCLTGRAVEPMWVDRLAYRLEKTTFAIGDRSLLYSLKEMMIAGTLCLESADVHRLFNATLANATVDSYTRSLIYSWFADYLILHEKNLPAAQQALSKALAIIPANTSNQLKWAQLLFLDGRKEKALHQLKTLSQSELNSTEKKTFAMLVNCIQASNCSRL